jgi:phosphoketolase
VNRQIESRAARSAPGYRPYFVEGSEPEAMHESMAATLDAIVEEI